MRLEGAGELGEELDCEGVGKEWELAGLCRGRRGVLKYSVIAEYTTRGVWCGC